MGPLAGIKVLELTGIGPMRAMLLDMGATVLRIDRPGPSDLGIDPPRSSTSAVTGDSLLEKMRHEA
jgi:alpha-methylacyl-CoA racemase